MKSLQAWLLPVIFVLVWSSGYVAGALATALIAPLAVTFWRFLLAAAVLAVIAAWRRESWPHGRALWAVAGVGVVLFGVQFGALYYGLALGVPAATTALIACSSPLLVAALSVPLGWERLGGRQWLGIALGVTGVAVTLADRLGRPPNVLDLGWTVLGLLGLAVGTMLQGRLPVGLGRSAVASVELIAAAAAIGAVAELAGPMRIPASLPAVLAFGWVALVAGVGAPLLMFTLIAQHGAMRTSTLLFVVPAITAVAAWPILHTPLGAATGAGLTIAGIGLLLALRAPRIPPGAGDGGGQQRARIAQLNVPTVAHQ